MSSAGSLAIAHVGSHAMTCSSARRMKGMPVRPAAPSSTSDTERDTEQYQRHGVVDSVLVAASAAPSAEARADMEGEESNDNDDENFGEEMLA